VIDTLYSLAKPALFRLDPEVVHDRTIAILGRLSSSKLALELLSRTHRPIDPRLKVEIAGLTLPGPIGVAAGLDKNGVAYPALHALGWNFIEVGTITDRPQGGNPKPRVFRLPEDHALINRMGFPGHGVDRIAMNLVMRRRSGATIGINIGPNKASVEAGLEGVIADITTLTNRLASLADYLVINISSPNTAKLRDLQGKAALAELLTAARSAIPARHPTPLFVKIAPDLTESEIDDIVEVVLATGITGIVATNTTLARPPFLRSTKRREAGGLSGAPLRNQSLNIVTLVARKTNYALPLLGVGGIASGADALAMLAAGAWAVQVYSGLIYEGPGLAARINQDLAAELDRRGLSTLSELRHRS
jgi:dihydroorotate dehydrogenase